MSTPYLDGVRAQADNLRRSADVVAAALSGGIGSRMVETVRRGLTLTCGMGASTHAAVGFAAVLRAAGRPAIAVSAADLAAGVPAGLAATVLGVSQSGRSRDALHHPGVPARSSGDGGTAPDRAAVRSGPGSAARRRARRLRRGRRAHHRHPG
ncbi:hypothetical protein DLE60_18675 [Micromonospora globispora]|uniref:SIS domain-containing protein n=1 Tax=Micromonospora globispora TaxID=1450148 RepID=A0A317K061_9ACTN|nr:hypothetical protein DLJ46_18255 [Micromonospora globispora]PWU59017.1 hypothetical protein DLE60_18675 [Micromonospora globispora]